MTEPSGHPAKLESRHQPPDFLLPRAGLQRSKNAKYFLSWNGEIYGPATEGEILAGMRASSFGEKALYWHEGSDEWKPLEKFLSEGKIALPDEWHQQEDADNRPGPSLETPSQSQGKSTRSKRRRRPPHKEKSRNGGLRIRVKLLIFGIVLLGVLLTVSILLLLMRIG